MAPLSWENPLLQDSRLDMDPLGWDKTDVLVKAGSYFMDNFIHLTGDQPALYNAYKSILFCPIIFIGVSKNLKVPLCHKEKLPQTSFC